MAVTLQSLYFFDEFTGLGGGGIEFLAGSIGDKIIAELTVDIKSCAENIPMTFTADGKTIERLDVVTYTIPTTPFTTGFYASFIQDGFKVGDTIEVVGSDNNDGTYTIVTVTDKIITVAEALVSETMDSSSIYGTTAVTAIDFYYNLIENSVNENYKSLFDTNNSNRFNCPTCAIPMSSTQMDTVGKSKAWVNGTAYIDDVAYPTAPMYTQRFKITHTFFITPLFIAQWKTNNDNSTNPKGFYNDLESLKYVANVEAKYLNLEATPAHTGDLSLDMNDGNVGYFDEFVNGFDANYTLKSIYYTDNASGDSVDSLQYDKATDVEIRITSVNSKFAAGCKVVLNQAYCSLDTRDYGDTTTDMVNNYRFDRVMLTEGAAAADGEQVGTDAQCITNAEATFISASELKITYTCDMANAYSAFIEAKDEYNRNFLIFCTPQDPAVTTTGTFDRNAVKCGWGAYFADLTNVSLWGTICRRNYGFLYNWYAATNVKKITSDDDWVVPTLAQWQTLSTYLGGNTVSGGKLKQTGEIYWDTNIGALDTVNFKARGGGQRNNVQGFVVIRVAGYFHCIDEKEPNYNYFVCILSSSNDFYESFGLEIFGHSIRLMRPATIAELLLPDGTYTDNYIGNDGKTYRAVVIGTQVWTAENLCETKYRDGSAIPEITDNTAWNTDTTGARCSYNNLQSYALTCANVTFFEYQKDKSGTTDYKGFANDIVYTNTLFQVESKIDAELTRLRVAIEATKIYETDIVLEEYNFNLTAFPLDKDLIQQIDIEQATRFKLPDGSDYAYYILRRYEDGDTGNFVAYELIYPFRIRYEDWVTLISEAYPNGTQDWASYEEDGWAIKFRIYADVYDNNTDHTTEFMHEADISVTGFDVTQAPPLTCEIKTYDSAGAIELDGLILNDANTLIEATFTGDFAALPDGFTDYYGIITLDNQEVGGAFYNQYTSTEETPIVGGIWYTAATLTVVDATTITVSAVIDYTKLKDLSAGRFPLNNLSFYARLGYKI